MPEPAVSDPNATDPTGLVCLGSLCSEDVVDTVENVVSTGVDNAKTTLALGADVVATYVPEAVVGAENWVNSHIGFNALACFGICIGATYQNGHFSLNYGAGWMFGATAGPTYSSNTSPDPWNAPCYSPPQRVRGLGPVTESSDHPGYSVGVGPGEIYGAADIYSVSLW